MKKNTLVQEVEDELAAERAKEAKEELREIIVNLRAARKVVDQLEKRREALLEEEI